MIHFCLKSYDRLAKELQLSHKNTLNRCECCISSFIPCFVICVQVETVCDIVCEVVYE